MFDDDDLMDDGGEEFCDFESGEEDDGNEDEEATEMEESVENLYYNAKNASAEEAEKDLRRIVELDESDRSEYGFKSYKKLLKMMVRERISSTEEAIVDDFKGMFTYMTVVGVNVLEEGVNTILDVAAAEKKFDLVEKLAGIGAESFLKSNYDRVWFRVNLKLAQIMIDAGRSETEMLEKLVSWCELAPGVKNPKKESLLLEVLAVQMQWALSKQSDDVTGKDGLRRLVWRAGKFESAIMSPTMLGGVHECSGRVMLYEHRWPEAKQELFEAFKNYDESGSPRRMICLRYVVLAALLENSGINPFESPETKSLVNHDEVVPMVVLWNAFESQNVSEFNEALKNAFENDAFGRSFVSCLILSFQRLKIAEIVKAYSKVRVSYIAKQLQISDVECRNILVEYILDGHLNGSLDQVNNILTLTEQDANETDVKYNSMAQWSSHISVVSKSISKKVVNNRNM